MTVSPGRFEIRWIPGSSRQFLNVELVAGGQAIQASSPADAGLLRTQALAEFLRKAQSPSDPIGVTLRVELPQGHEAASISFNLMSRSGEIRFEEQFEEAGHLDPIEGGIVRAVLFEQNGMWRDSTTEYQKLLEVSPESSILLRKLADLGCLVGGTEMFRSYYDRLEKSDQEGLVCEY
jgi:hypothetical protein